MASGIIGSVNGEIIVFPSMAAYQAAGAQSLTPEQVQQYNKAAYQAWIATGSKPCSEDTNAEVRAATLATVNQEQAAKVAASKTEVLYPDYSNVSTRRGQALDYTPLQYSYAETVSYQGRDGRVQIPKAISEAYGAGPGNKYYYAARQFVESKTGLSRQTGDQSPVSTKKNPSTGLYSNPDKWSAADRAAYDKQEAAKASKEPSYQYTAPIGPTREGGALPSSVSPGVPTMRSTINYQPIKDGLFQNVYTPEGSYIQQELSNIKVGGSESGELAFYRSLGKNESGAQRMSVNPDTGKLESFMLFGGGSRGAAQSGMFTTAAATPAVYREGRVAQKELITPAVMVPAVASSGLTGQQVLSIVKEGRAGDVLSKLGAEAYGGIVMRQDARTLGTIRYEDVGNRASWNLAAYFDPMAVNKGKSELPGAKIPWSVPEGAPAFFSMDKTGADLSKGRTVRSFDAVLSPEFQKTIGGGDRLVGSKTVASIATTTTLSKAGVEGRSPAQGGLSEYDRAILGGYSGGLIGRALWGEKAPVVIKGFIAASLFDATAGLLDLSGFIKRDKPAITESQVNAKTAAWKSNMTAYNANVSAFNDMYGGKELPEVDYARALKESFGLASRETELKAEQADVESAQKLLAATPFDKWGEFSKWSRSAGEQVTARRGYTKDQLETYGRTLESKPVKSLQDMTDRLSYGFVKTMSTDPGQIASGAGAGVIWAAGGEVVGGTLGAVAAGGGKFAPVAAKALAFSQSGLGQAIPLAAFGGLTLYSATEGGKATISKTLINIGADVPGLSAMGVASVGAGALIRSGVLGFRHEQMQMQRQSIDTKKMKTLQYWELWDLDYDLKKPKPRTQEAPGPRVLELDSGYQMQQVEVMKKSPARSVDFYTDDLLSQTQKTAQKPRAGEVATDNLLYQGQMQAQMQRPAQKQTLQMIKPREPGYNAVINMPKLDTVKTAKQTGASITVVTPRSLTEQMQLVKPMSATMQMSVAKGIGKTKTIAVIDITKAAFKLDTATKLPKTMEAMPAPAVIQKQWRLPDMFRITSDVKQGAKQGLGLANKTNPPRRGGGGGGGGVPFPGVILPVLPKIPVPPLIPSLYGGGTGYGLRGRGRRFTELFMPRFGQLPIRVLPKRVVVKRRRRKKK